jgi:Leucine-rich repeat (LRR) protein
MKYLKTYENKDGITFKEWLIESCVTTNATMIFCDDCNLIDLDGIEEFKNLIQLDCSNNKLTELPDLSNLTKLENLRLKDNRLKNLPDLTVFKNIYYLSCSGNNLPFEFETGNNLNSYLEWHKKEYPWVWDAKKYNL